MCKHTHTGAPQKTGIKRWPNKSKNDCIVFITFSSKKTVFGFWNLPRGGSWVVGCANDGSQVLIPGGQQGRPLGFASHGIGQILHIAFFKHLQPILLSVK
jgi:hypothetical protein